MDGSNRGGNQAGRARGGARAGVMAIAALAGFALAALAGLALASTTTKTLKTAHNKTLGKTIVVDSKGRTLYHPALETTRHLLCKNQLCFTVWPPYKVAKNAKLTKATGIKGKLGKLHRDGFWQVTLGGKPLYRFAGDHNKKGATNGNGFKAPFGTWHVLTASSSKGGGSTTTTHTSTSTSSTYTYPYP